MSFAAPRLFSMRSRPSPPLMSSVPSPLFHTSVSSPARPLILSLPGLPRMRSPPAPPSSVSAPVPPWTRSLPAPVVTSSSPAPASTVIGSVTSALVTSLSSPWRELMDSRSIVPMSSPKGPGAARSKRTRPPPMFLTVMSSVVLRPFMTCSSTPSSPSLVSVPSPLFQMNTSLPAPPSWSSLPVKPVIRSSPSPPMMWSAAGPPTMLSSPPPPLMVSVAAVVSGWVPGWAGSKSVAPAKPGAVPRLCFSSPLSWLMMMLSGSAFPVRGARSPVTAPVTDALAAAGMARAAAAVAATRAAVRRTLRVRWMSSMVGLTLRTAAYSSPTSERVLVNVTPELERDALGDHLDRLYRAAWALCGSREDAEDLVQETYTRVLAKRRTIGRKEDTLPYLLAVLRNTYVSSLRRRDRRPRTAPLEDSEERLPSSSAASPVAALAAREVFTAIAALPDDQRDALAAVDVAGLSYQEAADALEVPVGTIMSRLYRGRNRVAQTVGP